MRAALLALVLLPLAAVLEVGGDALVRRGIGAAGGSRALLLAAGAAALFAYGVAVNAAPWNFGRLLGIYVALFFVAAQLADAWAFGHRPGAAALVGGGLIVAGGLVLFFAGG